MNAPAFIVEADDDFGWRIDTADVLISAARDKAGSNATDAEIDAHLARLAVEYIIRPKKAATVRAHFIRLWPVIWPIAARSPASFDFILSELAERLSELG